MRLAAPLLETYWSPGLARRLKVNERLRLLCIAKGRLDLLLDILQFVRDKKEPRAVRKGLRGRLYLVYPHFGEGVLPLSAYELTVREWVGRKRIDVPGPQSAAAFLRRLVGKARRTVRSAGLHMPRRAHKV